MVQSWVEREYVREEGRTAALAGVMALLVFGEWYKPHMSSQGHGRVWL